MGRLCLDHWRYRYARRMRGILIALNIVMMITVFVAAAMGKLVIAFFMMALCGLFFLPVGMLGCYRCGYNVFRPYRGASYPEHGDSYTGKPAFPRPIPDVCPKCGAQLLSSG